jgi:hypothetical protein
MSDAIELLLERRPHPTAQKLLKYHRRNPTFFALFVGQMFWLKKRNRPGASKALFQFLREQERLRGVDRFTLNDHLFPLVTRIALLLFPALNNGMFELRPCGADQILGTTLAMIAGKKTRHPVLVAYGSLKQELERLPAPPVPTDVNRRSTRHVRVRPEEAAATFPFVKELIASSPHPRCRVLQLFRRHAKDQPEIFALVVRRLTARAKLPKKYFSIHADFEYAKRVAQRGEDLKKIFTLSGKIEALYCRAAIRRFPQFNGWTIFKEDSAGTSHKGRANRLLGCYLAPTTVNGEPKPRLHWLRDE